MTLGYKNIGFFILSLGWNFCKCAGERQREETKTDRHRLENCYIDPYLLRHVVLYSVPHKAPGLLPPSLCVVLIAAVTLWLTIWCGCMCIYIISNALMFWLSTHVSCLHPHITVFLLTQLEHDGSVKSQYATFMKRKYLIWQLKDLMNYGRGDGYFQLISITLRNIIKGKLSKWHSNTLQVIRKEMGAAK